MSDASSTHQRVQEMLEGALEILDSGPYPADIGAHLDLAIHRLREHLASLGAQKGVGTSGPDCGQIQVWDN